VKLLALARGRRATREQLIETLWPELAPRAGAANLHKAAHYARAALGARDVLVLRVEALRSLRRLRWRWTRRNSSGPPKRP
jgi:DNA-binding SARP family transcriptional activator